MHEGQMETVRSIQTFYNICWPFFPELNQDSGAHHGIIHSNR